VVPLRTGSVESLIDANRADVLVNGVNVRLQIIGIGGQDGLRHQGNKVNSEQRSGSWSPHNPSTVRLAQIEQIGSAQRLPTAPVSVSSQHPFLPRSETPRATRRGPRGSANRPGSTELRRMMASTAVASGLAKNHRADACVPGARQVLRIVTGNQDDPLGVVEGEWQTVQRIRVHHD